MAVDDNRIADMTKDDLRTFIRQTIEEMLWEYEQQYGSDDDLEFEPELAERLRAFLRDKPRGKSLAEIERDLGLDKP